MEIRPIAYVHTDFTEKFGIPRQSGRVESLTAKIVFEPEYRREEALREIEGFSHLWLLFDFSLSHRAGWSPTVRPPRLGGNRRVGVFASRSPFRPNFIGLSCVRLLQVLPTMSEGTALIVSGADLLDGTPVYDIKPYLPATDCRKDARGGYADEFVDYRLETDCPQELLNVVPAEKRRAFLDCLSEDPRPAYIEDPDRVYGFTFAGVNAKFRVEGRRLTVLSVEKI